MPRDVSLSDSKCWNGGHEWVNNSCVYSQVSMAGQLSQSAHMALQLPYTIFGLGRNWNFVEFLQVKEP